MKRIRTVLAIASVVVLAIVYFVVTHAQDRANSVAEYTGLAPTPEQIRAQIGSASAPARGLTEAERRNLFVTLFKKRYRDHSPPIAIGVRFTDANHLKLMCQARLEPCYMDQVAIAAWKETKDIFGVPADVDIYETFIGTNQIQIGKVRPMVGQPSVAHLTYDYTELQRVVRLAAMAVTVKRVVPHRRRIPIGADGRVRVPGIHDEDAQMGMEVPRVSFGSKVH